MVYIFLAKGFEEIEAITCADILKRAGEDVRLVSTETTKMVLGAHEINIESDIMLSECDFKECRMIVLPGGMPGTTNLLKNKELTDQIVKFDEEGKMVAAICAAPMILGKLNLINNRRATIYPGMEEYLNGAICSKDKVVVDENIITSQCPATAMEFALKLAELLAGNEKALQVKEGLALK